MSAGGSKNDIACSNGVVMFGFSVGRGLETAADLAELMLSKAEVVLGIVKVRFTISSTRVRFLDLSHQKFKSNSNQVGRHFS